METVVLTCTLKVMVMHHMDRIRHPAHLHPSHMMISSMGCNSTSILLIISHQLLPMGHMVLLLTRPMSMEGKLQPLLLLNMSLHQLWIKEAPPMGILQITMCQMILIKGLAILLMLLCQDILVLMGLNHHTLQIPCYFLIGSPRMDQKLDFLRQLCLAKIFPLKEIHLFPSHFHNTRYVHSVIPLLDSNL